MITVNAAAAVSWYNGYMSEQILITKTNGEKEPFDEEKLVASLRRSRASAAAIQAVLDHIHKEIREGMTTTYIYQHALELLHKVQKSAAISYSLRRAIADLGPSGFPFEKFVAEIFKQQGYTTLTDQVVAGKCVEHEVDVVAWKPDGDLAMVEAKFHNQPGLKCDLKVALYVKARFDDLAQATFTYDNQAYHLKTGWLVTNTKFTISAIKYAACQTMKIVGWSYPHKGNLQDLIESAHLHPLTCLRLLSEHDKKALLGQGIVLCRDLEKDPSLLSKLGLAELNIDAILSEISHIYADDMPKNKMKGAPTPVPTETA